MQKYNLVYLEGVPSFSMKITENCTTLQFTMQIVSELNTWLASATATFHGLIVDRQSTLTKLE